MSPREITKNAITQHQAQKSDGNVHYSAQAALLCAEAASWSYYDAKALATHLQGLGMASDYRETYQVENTALRLQTTAFLTADFTQKIAILSFRGAEFGTGNSIDLMADIAIESVPFHNNPNWKVHGGFYHNLHAIWQELLPGMKQMLPKIDILYITGHSLGGALATVATAELFLNSCKTSALATELSRVFAGLYSFGQPMVGNELFADACEQQFGELAYRHVYHKDLIPRLPPKSTGHFHHFGHEYHADTANVWTRANSVSDQIYSLLISLPLAGIASIAKQFPWARHLPGPYSMADHLPYFYLEAARRSAKADSATQTLSASLTKVS